MGKGQGLISRGLAIAAIAACAVVAPLAGVAVAGQGEGGSDSTDVRATLRVEAQNVTVKKAGADAFKEATDGQKLREGDTVRTDATGRAEVDYSEDAYTRLDVNTTFTITKLTEQEGERQVEGSLESGRTWNRTEAITESGTFDQSGGGATAAVAGTAFSIECTSLEHCDYTAVFHDIILSGDGQQKRLTPRDECDATSGQLCEVVTKLSIDEIAADTWIQDNLLRDLLERGYGPGPFVVSGVLIVENGQVVDFVPSGPPPTNASNPAGGGGGGGGGGGTTHVIDASMPILVADQTTNQVFVAAIDCASRGLPEGCAAADHIEVQEGETVLFTANVVPGTATAGLTIRFTNISDPDGAFRICENGSQECNNIAEGDVFDITHVFALTGQPNGGGSQGSFSFEVLSEGVATGETVTIPVAVTETSGATEAATTASIPEDVGADETAPVAAPDPSVPDAGVEPAEDTATVG